MTVKEARRILERSAKGGVSYVHDSGYRWYVDKFLSAIRILEGQRHATRRDHFLISEAYYIDGDVHDFNDAPQAAIKSYRRCLKWAPTAGGAWREMGGMYDHLGRSKEALRCLRKAVKVDPRDDNNTGDLESFLKWVPIRKKDLSCADRGWKAREALASLKPRAALRFLEHPKSSTTHQLRARVYGALGEADSVLQEWEAIAGRSDRVDLQWGDWFYLPDDIYTGSLRFWEAHRRIWRRWDGTGVTFGPENLWKIIPSSRRKWLMVIWFHIAKLKKDYQLARRISVRYPKWKEAVALARKIKAGKRSNELMP